MCMMPFPNLHPLSPFRDALRNERPQGWPSLVPPSLQQEESASAERELAPGKGQRGRGPLPSVRGLDSSVSLSLTRLYCSVSLAPSEL